MEKDIKNETSENAGFAVPHKNYKLMLIGLAIIVLGFVLMTGGGSDDPNVFNEEIFSFTRITLSSILVVFGFAFEIYAIMKKPKSDSNKESKTDKEESKRYSK